MHWITHTALTLIVITSTLLASVFVWRHSVPINGEVTAKVIENGKRHSVVDLDIGGQAILPDWPAEPGERVSVLLVAGHDAILWSE